MFAIKLDTCIYRPLDTEAAILRAAIDSMKDKDKIPPESRARLAMLEAVPESDRPAIHYRPALAGEYTDAQVHAWQPGQNGRGGTIIERSALEHMVASCITSIDNVGFEENGTLAPIVWKADAPISDRIATVRKLTGPWFNVLANKVQELAEISPEEERD